MPANGRIIRSLSYLKSSDQNPETAKPFPWIVLVLYHSLCDQNHCPIALGLSLCGQTDHSPKTFFDHRLPSFVYPGLYDRMPFVPVVQDRSDSFVNAGQERFAFADNRHPCYRIHLVWQRFVSSLTGTGF